MSLLNDVRVGAQRPLHRHLPPGAAGKEAGEEAAELAESIGLVLDDWQRWVLREALAERADGKWAAFEAGLVVPRQNGKGAVLEALELAGLLLFGERLVVHSAHKFDTAQEHFLRMQQHFRHPDLEPLVQQVLTANGKESIKLRSGARLKFIARSRGGGRGFSGDRIVLDEAYDLPVKAVGAMLPTMSARPNPQVWYVSSAPHFDSAVLKGVRKRGMSDDGGRLFYAEWGNEPGVDFDDRDGWYRANPALGIRISEEYVGDELRSMRDEMPEEFQRERLGVAEVDDGRGGLIPFDRWSGLVDVGSSVATKLSLGLAVSPDRGWVSFGAAGQRSDGLGHLETVDRRAGTGWVVERAGELAERYGVPIRLNPAGPAGGFVRPLAEAGVSVVEVTQRANQQACAEVLDLVLNRTTRHLGQDSLSRAVAAATALKQGQAWVWARPGAVDITPLEAVTLAWSGVSGANGAASEPLMAFT